MRCDDIHDPARTMPSSRDLGIRVITVLSIISETQGLKILLYLYYSEFLFIAQLRQNTKLRNVPCASY